MQWHVLVFVAFLGESLACSGLILDLSEYCEGLDLSSVCKGIILDSPWETWFDNSIKLDYVSIVFVDSNMSVLPNNTFRVLEYVEYFEAGGCSIQNLTRWNFDGASNLQKLVLRQNDIEVLSDEVFGELVNLNHLDLEMNSIYKIEQKAFFNLSNLNSLFLSRNNIDAIPLGMLVPLKALKVLDLGWNRISYIDNNAFEHNLELTEVVLEDNFLKFVDDKSHAGYGSYRFWNNLTKLERLNLAGNYLGKVDARTFSSLGKLKLLDLTLTGLNEIEDEAFRNNKELRTLYLSQNFLVVLNLGEDVWRNLQNIRITANNLTKIDYWHIETETSIREILLRQNSWDCAFLHKMVIRLKARDITVGMDPLYSQYEPNVDGVPCIQNDNPQGLFDPESDDTPNYPELDISEADMDELELDPDPDPDETEIDEIKHFPDKWAIKPINEMEIDKTPVYSDSDRIHSSISSISNSLSDLKVSLATCNSDLQRFSSELKYVILGTFVATNLITIGCFVVFVLVSNKVRK